MSKLILPRRTFLQTVSAAATLPMLSGAAQAVSENGKLRTAHIGVGGMGAADLNSIAGHKKVEVFALCDVDQNALDKQKERFPHAKMFRDFREMLSEIGKDIDAVVVSTPDHTHAPAAMSALNLNKPVYCQKPLTHEIYEARQLRLAAEKRGVPTQMGIQIHSSALYRKAVQLIQEGAIGKVSAVHAWSNKNWGYDGGPLTKEAEPPKNLDWNLWIGTAAMRPYVPGAYHPGAWRKMIDFGTGTLGDMGVHICDTPFTALELTAPTWVQTSCRTPTGIGHPERNVVRYEFPGTKYTTNTLSFTWYDGSHTPPRNSDLNVPENITLPGQASYIIGEEGSLLLPHVGDPQLFPEKKFRDYKRPQLAEVNHYHQWVDACLGEGKASADFTFAAKLTEALLLGVVANRFPDTKLAWNAEKLEIVDHPEANKLIKRNYRDGFQVEGL